MRKYIAYSAVVAIIAIFLIFSLDQAGGPVSDMRGVVEVSGYVPSGAGPAVQIASVRLADGTLVQATVDGSVTVHPGQLAHIRAYQRIITGARKYEVVSTARAQ